MRSLVGLEQVAQGWRRLTEGRLRFLKVVHGGFSSPKTTFSPLQNQIQQRDSRPMAFLLRASHRSTQSRGLGALGDLVFQKRLRPWLGHMSQLTPSLVQKFYTTYTHAQLFPSRASFPSTPSPEPSTKHECDGLLSQKKPSHDPNEIVSQTLMQHHTTCRLESHDQSDFSNG